MTSRLIRFLLMFLLVPATSLEGSGRSTGKLDTVLAGAARQAAPGYARVIIRTRPGAQGRIAQALRAHGDALGVELTSIRALTAFVHVDDLAALEASSDVLSVSADVPIWATVSRSHVRPEQAAVLEQLDVLRGSLGLDDVAQTGADIGIAIVDTGIEETLDLRGRVSAFYDFTQGGVATRPYDDHGHGTHIANLIAADGRGPAKKSAYAGVAPGVRLIGLKALDANGGGYTSDVIAAVEFATRYKESLGIDILNLSLGHPIYEPASSDPLVHAVEAATRAGIVVVVSAGNFGSDASTKAPGYAGITSPGNAPSAITVGAVDMKGTATRLDDEVPFYSSRGPTWFDGYAKPDLVAPGDQLVADAAHGRLYTDYSAYQVRGQVGYYYMNLSGTSMASGVASGVAALVLEASRAANPDGPALTPNAVKAILQYTAVGTRAATGHSSDAIAEGTGGLNAVGAIALASLIDTSAPAGSPWLRNGFSPTSAIGGDTVTWGQKIVWGADILGGSVIDRNVEAFLRKIVWGATDVWSDSDASVYAEARNIVWGNSAVWARNIVWGADALDMHGGQDAAWGGAAVSPSNIVWANLADPARVDIESILSGLANSGVF